MNRSVAGGWAQRAEILRAEIARLEDEEEMIALQKQALKLELAGCSSIAEAELVSKFSRFLDLDEDEDGLGACQG